MQTIIHIKTNQYDCTTQIFNLSVIEKIECTSWPCLPHQINDDNPFVGGIIGSK